MVYTTCISSQGFIRDNRDLINVINFKYNHNNCLSFFSRFPISDYRALRILNGGLKTHFLVLTDSCQQNQHIFPHKNEHIIMAAS